MNIRVQSNIWKIGVIKALRWFMLMMPTIVLFFQENGLSMKEVLLLQSLFSVAVIIFEIPSGYFSDVVGRKATIVLACILSFLGFSIYTISYGFTGFLIAELVLGLGSSFLSGTDSAILYDSLLQANRDGEYKKYEGRLSAVGNFSEALASFAGGLLAVISLRTPIYAEAIVVFFSIPLALTLVEPARKAYKNTEGSIREIAKIVTYCLHQHSELKWLMVYSAIVGASTLTMAWFVQPYFLTVGLPLAYFGIAWGLLNISTGMFSLYAHKIEMTLGRTRSLVMLIFLSFLGSLLLALFQSLWAMVFLLLFYFVRGVNNPIIQDYVNRLITSDMRATVLSVKNLVGRILFAIIGPFIGWITDVYSLQVALITSGSMFLGLGVISLLFLRKYKAV